MRFDAPMLLIVRGGVVEPENLALFLLQIQPFVCAQTLPIPHCHPNSLLRSRFDRHRMSRWSSAGPGCRSVLTHLPRRSIFEQTRLGTADEPQVCSPTFEGIEPLMCMQRQPHASGRVASPGYSSC